MLNKLSAGSNRLKSLEGALAGVKGECDAREREKDEAREESQLTLLQLHQVQEELQGLFRKLRYQDDLFLQHQKQGLAMRQALAKFVIARG